MFLNIRSLEFGIAVSGERLLLDWLAKTIAAYSSIVDSQRTWKERVVSVQEAS